MPGLSRRAFAERLALAAAAPFILGDLPAFLAATPGTLPVPLPPPAPPPAGRPDPSPLAQALTEAIRVRYGDRLSAADLETVARVIQARLEGLERLYRVPLANADEPDFVFAAYRGDA